MSTDRSKFFTAQSRYRQDLSTKYRNTTFRLQNSNDRLCRQLSEASVRRSPTTVVDNVIPACTRFLTNAANCNIWQLLLAGHAWLPHIGLRVQWQLRYLDKKRK